MTRPSVKRRNVYVAGSTSDIERVNQIQQVVTDAGGQIAFDWTGAEGEIRTDGSWDTVPARGAEIAAREVDACRTADLTIVLCPPRGRGLGCWIEMGATLAAGGEVWVVEAKRDSVFWQHPQVRRFATIEEIETTLRGGMCPSPLCGRPLAECPCSFCHGTPVGNAATWLDGVSRPPAACPRCGKTTPYSEATP